MELRTLSYFLAVAQEENFSNAAKFLHISQPTLSRQIMDLEEEFGKNLFIRGKRKVTLTEDGLLLRKRATEMINLANKTEQEMKADTDIIAGDIYIGAGETQSMKFIADVAKHLSEKHIDLHYHIYSGDSSEIRERLDKGLIDFGLVLDNVDPTKYFSIDLPSFDNWGVLMRYDDVLASASNIRSKDLWDKPLIISRQATKDGLLLSWLKKDVSELNIIATYTLVFNGSMLASSGLGYALVIDKLVNTTKESELVFRPFSPPLQAGIHIIWKKNQVFSRAANAFLQALKNAPGVSED